MTKSNYHSLAKVLTFLLRTVKPSTGYRLISTAGLVSHLDHFEIQFGQWICVKCTVAALASFVTFFVAVVCLLLQFEVYADVH